MVLFYEKFGLFEEPVFKNNIIKVGVSSLRDYDAISSLSLVNYDHNLNRINYSFLFFDPLNEISVEKLMEGDKGFFFKEFEKIDKYYIDKDYESIPICLDDSGRINFNGLEIGKLSLNRFSASFFIDNLHNFLKKLENIYLTEINYNILNRECETLGNFILRNYKKI